MQKRISLKHYWRIPIISIAAAVGLNIILLASDIARYSEAYKKAAEVLYAPSFAVQILYSGILMPILEELLFRGVLFRLLRRKLPFVWAAVLSSIVFGVYHGNLVQFIYASLCGLLLAYLYEVYKSIAATIFAHMVMNITANIFTELGVFSWILGNVLCVVLFTFICTVIVLSTFICIQKMYKEPKNDILRKC